MGEELLSSPSPEPSPIKGEGSGSKVARMTYLPLSALPWAGKEQALTWQRNDLTATHRCRWARTAADWYNELPAFPS
jgi:hypothetical protein